MVTFESGVKVAVESTCWRLAASAEASVVDEVFPDQPVRQWVLSIPIPLRFLCANRPSVIEA